MRAFPPVGYEVENPRRFMELAKSLLEPWVFWAFNGITQCARVCVCVQRPGYMADVG